jgi:hypothetical protein
MGDNPICHAIEPWEGSRSWRDLVDPLPRNQEDLGRGIGRLRCLGASSAIGVEELAVFLVDLGKPRLLIRWCLAVWGDTLHHNLLVPGRLTR